MEKLYRIFRITVERLGAWLPQDIDKNAGKLIRHDDTSQILQCILALQTKLQKRRQFNVCLYQSFVIFSAEALLPPFPFHLFVQDPPPGVVDEYLSVAKAGLGELFESAFEASGDATQEKAADHMEFLAFANAGYRFHKDSNRVASDNSSSLKSTAFTYSFVLPPCLSQEKKHKLSYEQ